jgi:two-component system chemotaxis response regulator CheB
MKANGHNILFISQDPDKISAMARSLESKKSWDSLVAKTVQQALQVLTQQDFSLVVFDRDHFNEDDLALLEEIRFGKTDLQVIPWEEINPAESEEADHREEKEEREVRSQDGFEGKLKIFQLADILQMYCLSGATVSLRVKQNSLEGMIFIQKGKIVHARCNEMVGEEAFYQIVSWKKGIFEMEGSLPPPEITIEKSWEFLLLEGARLSDELAVVNLPTSPLEPGSADEAAERNLQVLIVDDSPFMSNLLRELLTADGKIQVTGVAHNGEEALKMIARNKPDLITLDVNMPVMNGGTMLKHIMVKNPCPVVIVSRPSEASMANIVDFLQMGAADFISKPRKHDEMPGRQKELVHRVKEASQVKVENFRRVRVTKALPGAKKSMAEGEPCELLVVINSSAGGYGEMIRFLSLVPQAANTGFIALQGMDQEFFGPFSRYLDAVSPVPLVPLDKDVPLLGGRCHMGSFHDSYRFSAEKEGHFLRRLASPGIENRTTNPFDCLLCSIAENFPGKVMVALLSGAETGDFSGLQSIKKRGGWIVTLPISLCGTPDRLEKVHQAGLADRQGTPEEISKWISRAAMENSPGGSPPDRNLPDGRSF